MCDLSDILVLRFLNWSDSVENCVGTDGVFVVSLVGT